VALLAGDGGWGAELGDSAAEEGGAVTMGEGKGEGEGGACSMLCFHRHFGGGFTSQFIPLI